MASPRSSRSSTTPSPFFAPTGSSTRRRDSSPTTTSDPAVKVLLSLQDVEPAVRINAEPEGDGVDTALGAPLDDSRAALKREKPDIIVFTGELTDPSTVAIAKEQLW